jgi:hypothetical protein
VNEKLALMSVAGKSGGQANGAMRGFQFVEEKTGREFLDLEVRNDFVHGMTPKNQSGLARDEPYRYAKSGLMQANSIMDSVRKLTRQRKGPLVSAVSFNPPCGG